MKDPNVWNGNWVRSKINSTLVQAVPPTGARSASTGGPPIPPLIEELLQEGVLVLCINCTAKTGGGGGAGAVKMTPWAPMLNALAIGSGVMTSCENAKTTAWY